MLCLIVTSGPDRGRVFHLPQKAKSRVVIGRQPSSGVVLRDSRISREHAELVLMASGWVINDLRSRNGTYVNAMRVDDYMALDEHDQIQMGRSNLVFTPKLALHRYQPEDMGEDDLEMIERSGTLEAYRCTKCGSVVVCEPGGGKSAGRCTVCGARTERMREDPGVHSALSLLAEAEADEDAPTVPDEERTISDAEPGR